jgi:hypothetical protein
MLPEARTTVAVLSGNPLAGRALELLLEGAGYEVVLLEEPEALLGVEDLLAGVDVLLLGRGLSEGRREYFLKAIASTLETAAIPVLSMSPGPEGAPAKEDLVVPWPSRIEDLAREIEAARRTAGGGEPLEGSRPLTQEAST